MGMHNVVAVLTYWPQLTHRDMRLLVHMAVTALDPPGIGDYPPCMYWAEWDTQAAAMGWGRWKDTDAQRGLRRVRAELLTAGAIRLQTPSRKGRGPCWELLTTPGMGGQWRPSWGGQ